MRIVTIRVEGMSPLLMHNPENMLARDSANAKKKTIPTAEEEAKGGLYRTADDTLYLPTTAFAACARRAAVGRRIGKTAATSVVKGALFPATEITPLLTPDGEPLDEYDIDVRRAVVQRQAVNRARPKFEKWAASVAFDLDEEFLPEPVLRDLLEIGGKTVGVGDFRPECSGPFGRFRLVD